MELPKEIIWNVLTFLSLNDIYTSFQVNKKWGSISKNKNFWKEINILGAGHLGKFEIKPHPFNKFIKIDSEKVEKIWKYIKEGNLQEIKKIPISVLRKANYSLTSKFSGVDERINALVLSILYKRKEILFHLMLLGGFSVLTHGYETERGNATFVMMYYPEIFKIFLKFGNIIYAISINEKTARSWMRIKEIDWDDFHGVCTGHKNANITQPKWFYCPVITFLVCIDDIETAKKILSISANKDLIKKICRTETEKFGNCVDMAIYHNRTDFLLLFMEKFGFPSKWGYEIMLKKQNKIIPKVFNHFESVYIEFCERREKFLSTLDFREGTFQVFIKNLTGNTHTINIMGTDEIEEVKLLVTMKTGIPVIQQRLTYGGKQLEDMRTVDDYGIKENATIFLLLRLRG